MCVGLSHPQGTRDHSLSLSMGLTMAVALGCWGWAGHLSGVAGVSGLGARAWDVGLAVPTGGTHSGLWTVTDTSLASTIGMVLGLRTIDPGVYESTYQWSLENNGRLATVLRMIFSSRLV